MSTNVAPVIHAVALEALGLALRAKFIVVSWLDGDTLTFPFVWGDVPRDVQAFINKTVPVAEHPLAATLVQTGFAYYGERSFNQEGETVLKTFDLMVAVEPLKRSDGTVMAFLNVGREAQAGLWTQEDRKLLQESTRTMTRDVEQKVMSQQQAEAEKISKARLEGLLQVSSSLSQALTPNDVYEIVLEQSVKVLGIRAGGVTVVKEDGSLEIIAAKGQPPGIVEAQQYLPVTADHPVAETVRGGEALYFRSRAERDQRFPHMTHLFSPATHSSAFVPLRSQGKAIGALTLSFPEPHAFDEAERDYMAALADTCARALERARSFEREQQAKEHYQTLFNSIDESFCIFEMLANDVGQFYDYRFLEVNPKFEEHTGLKNAVGKTAKELVPGLEQHWVDIYGKIAATGESIRFEQGSAAMGRWFEVYGTRVGGQDSKKVALVFKDISEQKRSEDQLRESEYRLSIASRAARIGIHDYDVRNNHIYWDDTLRSIWGVTAEEVISYETFAAGLHPDDLASTETAVNRAFDPAGSGQYYAEYRVINRQNLETHWVAASGHTFFEEGRAVRLIGTAQDITERKKGEEQLQSANARFRLAEEAAHSFSYEWNLNTGVVERSPNLQQVLGYAPGELATTWEGWALLFHPDDPQIQSQREAIAFLNRYPDTVYGYEYRARHKAGHYLWLHERGLIVRDHTGKVVRVIGQTVDISERKNRELNLTFLSSLQKDVALLSSAEDMMKTAGELVARHFNLTHCLFVEIDEHAAQAEVLYDRHRPNAPDLRGVYQLRNFHTEDEQERLKRGETIVIHDVREAPRPPAAATGFEALLVRSLVTAPYVSDGRWTFALSAQHDHPYLWRKDETMLLTELADWLYPRLERVRVEEELKVSEERLRLGMDVANFALADIDYLANTIHLSKEAALLYGLGKEERTVPRERVHATFHPDDRAWLARLITEVLDPKGKGEMDCEHRVVLPDGEVRWLNVHKQIFFNREADTPHPTSGLLAAQDITARKEAEQALREADKRKDEFLATLAHELRNPLAPIRMGIEIMKRSQDKATRFEAQAIIERQTNQLVHLVDDLLDISRITRGKINLYKEHLTLAEIIHLALESARPLMSEGKHELVLELPTQEVVLEADKTRLCQVFLNLLTNAAKYSDAGGKITVRAELEAEAVRVSVKDTGIGIAPDMLSHVFDLFTRVESGEAAKREGLGIGLSLVKQLVQMHGGSVTVSSLGLGHGSDFTVRLPVIREAVRTGVTVSQTKETSSTSHRILVVDDYEANLKTLSRMLRLMGHEVMTASDGHKALEALNSFTPDLILLDINMPGLSGYEVAKLIKTKPHSYSHKLVALTGYGAEEDIRKAKEAGFDHHLVKPVEMGVLEELLRVSPAT